MRKRSVPSVLGLILFCHYIILHELIHVPRNSFRGSLIPQQPYVVGRVAMQSASRDDEIVRCRADYKVANGKAAIFAYQNLVYANTEWTGYR